MLLEKKVVSCAFHAKVDEERDGKCITIGFTDGTFLPLTKDEITDLYDNHLVSEENDTILTNMISIGC